MTKIADRVYTEQADIQRLEDLVPLLPGGRRVALEMEDGDVLAGIVSARPTVQQFRDLDDREGANGLVRIDDIEEPAKHLWVWLDRITRVRALGPEPSGAAAGSG